MLFRFLSRSWVSFLKYYIDPKRIEERRQLEKDRNLETMGQALQKHRLRLVGSLIERELHRLDSNASGSSGSASNQTRE
jgi:hypothetical protein